MVVQIAIMGLGVVGGGTADLLTENHDLILARTGVDIQIKYILDIRDLPDSPYADRIVHDISVIASDPEIAVVAETIGGVHPAYEFTRRLLESGKSVVSSNKQLVSEYGVELLSVAAEAGCVYLYEASTGGGIPILSPLRYDLAGNEISEISGILNGTTNYILTRMISGGIDFADALAEAQAKGYAEANPTADVEGHDAARKIAILAATAYGRLIPTERIHTEGIRGIRLSDVRAAESIGARIKLLGRAVRTAGEFFVMVAPFLVFDSCPLSRIDDVYNGVLVHGNYVGDVLFYGRGAGAKATASAVAADLIAAASDVGVSALRNPIWTPADESEPTDFESFTCRHYVALSGVESNAVDVIFGKTQPVPTVEGEIAFLTELMTEREALDKLDRLYAAGAILQSRIRVCDRTE